jgi:predicted 2-oxoglutarate/Fe(II)-dependent dioxygenase YbiX
MQKLWDGYYKYIQDLSLPFFNSWEGFSQVRYNRYSPGQTMAMHCDHIRTLFDGQRRGIPILSAVGLLNDNYKGGEFIMWEDEIKLKAGDLLVFPSAFVYPHLVNPVKSGTRYSLVAWSW